MKKARVIRERYKAFLRKTLNKRMEAMGRRQTESVVNKIELNKIVQKIMENPNVVSEMNEYVNIVKNEWKQA